VIDGNGPALASVDRQRRRGRGPDLSEPSLPPTGAADGVAGVRRRHLRGPGQQAAPGWSL